MRVDADSGSYVGSGVRAPSPDSSACVMLYGNAARSTLARLAGPIVRGRLVLSSVTPGRTRASRAEIERIDAAR